MPALSRPETCHVCVLHRHAEGFALPDGPVDSWLLLVGEALGKVEALTGRPFMGDAGGMLQRLLNMLGWKRDAIRVHNVISCRPPNDWFDERAPWYKGAFNYCPYLENTLRENHPVVVPMGGTALRRVMGLQHARKIRVQDFHGSILRDPSDRFYVVPTYHPSFLQRGAHNLIGTVLWDLLQAREAFERGKPKDPATIVIDPPIEWFRAWVEIVIAARLQDPWAYPISSDVETPDKAGGRDEGEITNEDRSYQIQRVNVACNTDEGVTVPGIEPYLTELRRLHLSPGPIWEWNKEYDFPRQLAIGMFASEADQRRVIDLMWLAHFLQSDVPRGLGYWAPFYSTYGPWKHLAEENPGLYGGVDGLQTHRIGFGVISDLIKMGMHDSALRHVHKLHWAALRPAQLVGVKVDRQRLIVFKEELTTKATARLNALQGCYPEDLMPLTPKQGMTKPPLANVLHVKASAFTRKGKLKAGKQPTEMKLDLYKRAKVVERIILKEVLVCKSCGEIDVPRRHRCRVAYQKKDGSTGWRASPNSSDISLQVASVSRWYWQEPFNPDSWQQVLSFIKHKGTTDKRYTPGRAKKTHKDSTDRETLERLKAKTKDPFFGHLLDYRAIVKVKGTYVEGTERRLDHEDRVHPTPTFKPSMMRLSYVDPNITNVVADKGQEGKKGLAAGFRKCIVASPGCRLLEVDFASIEAVKVGMRAQDPDYIRLARLGVHSGMCTYIQGKPFDKSWLRDRPQDLKALFDEIKYSDDPKTLLMYDRTKRFVHGKAYGLTVFGMVLQFPELFPTMEVAERYARIFGEMAPKVEQWQKATQQIAATLHYLGGVGGVPYGADQQFNTAHPYGYKHWFWSVYNYKRLTTVQYYKLLGICQRKKIEPPIAVINDQYFRVGYGEDAKRSLAFYPQSIAAGDLKEAEIALFDPDSPSFIGDAYYGRTPLRGPIHDSLLLEIPDRAWDRTIEKIFMEMQRPMLTQPLPAEWELGAYIANTISAKVGHDWDQMEKIKVPGFSDLEPSYWTPSLDEDEEDGLDLQRTA
jgi:DNA polymerase